ncbi:hypothetical protein [Streptomyces pseudoechinosporeus]
MDPVRSTSPRRLTEAASGAPLVAAAGAVPAAAAAAPSGRGLPKGN